MTLEHCYMDVQQRMIEFEYLVYLSNQMFSLHAPACQIWTPNPRLGSSPSFVTDNWMMI